MWMWQGLRENKDYENFIYVGRIVVEMASYWGARLQIKQKIK
jgi:predicted GNAT superfamily acetyltransferase